MDPAKKQYWIFSAIIAFLISFVVNFWFFDLLKGSVLYGFPFNLKDAVGLGSFILRLINTLIIGGLITPGIYFFFQWMMTRAR